MSHPLPAPTPAAGRLAAVPQADGRVDVPINLPADGRAGEPRVEDLAAVLRSELGDLDRAVLAKVRRDCARSHSSRPLGCDDDGGLTNGVAVGPPFGVAAVAAEIDAGLWDADLEHDLDSLVEAFRVEFEEGKRQIFRRLASLHGEQLARQAFEQIHAWDSRMGEAMEKTREESRAVASAGEVAPPSSADPGCCGYVCDPNGAPAGAQFTRRGAYDTEALEVAQQCPWPPKPGPGATRWDLDRWEEAVLMTTWAAHHLCMD